MSWKHWYRVDAVPRRWWPVYLPLSYGLAALLCVFVRVARRTCRIEIRGQSLAATPRFIWALWHEHVWLSWVVLGDWRGQGWLNHPYWYMRPIHLAATWDGVETLYLGSSGNDGRAALEKMVEGVRGGQNTMVMPDGPSGPRRKARPGVALTAAATGLPVIPLRFEWSRCWRLGGWDQKPMPIPFVSRITLTVGAPIFVDSGDISKALQAITEALGASAKLLGVGGKQT